jgi:hypothetical protein
MFCVIVNRGNLGSFLVKREGAAASLNAKVRVEVSTFGISTQKNCKEPRIFYIRINY